MHAIPGCFERFRQFGPSFTSAHKDHGALGIQVPHQVSCQTHRVARSHELDSEAGTCGCGGGGVTNHSDWQGKQGIQRTFDCLS